MKKLGSIYFEVLPKFEYQEPAMMTGVMLVFVSDNDVIKSEIRDILPAVDFTKNYLLVHIDPANQVIIDKHSYHILIHNVILDYFGITAEHIRRRKRNRDEYITPRHIAYYFTHKFCRGIMSLERIGNYYGGFDHATVLSGKRNIQNLLDANDSIITEHYINLHKLITEKLNTHEETSSTNKTSLVA